MTAVSAAPGEPAPTDGAVYRRDVEFLLAELPARAGSLIRSKRIDWDAVRSEFRGAADAVSSDADHVTLCTRLLARLRDGHAGIVDSRVTMPDVSNGRRWTGPRVHLLEVGNRVFVRAAFKDAATAGVRLGDEVIRIDGVPARQWLDARVASLRDRQGFSTDHQARFAACHWGLAEWEGTSIAFVLRPPTGGPEKEVTIVRGGGPNFAPIGPVVFPAGVQSIGRQTWGKSPGGFGYIHLRDVPADLPAQLDRMLEAIGDVPGLILDMRGNGGGGCDHGAVFGRFVPRSEYWGEFESAGPHPFGGRMVVIIDAGVRSAGETVSGLFREESRAFTIGDSPTAGMSSRKERLAVPSGLFTAAFSVRTNMTRFNDRRGIEGIGIVPHETVAYDPSELARGVDTLIRRADDLLRGGFPPDEIDYVPPAERKTPEPRPRAN